MATAFHYRRQQLLVLAAIWHAPLAACFPLAGMTAPRWAAPATIAEAPSTPPMYHGRELGRRFAEYEGGIPMRATEPPEGGRDGGAGERNVGDGATSGPTGLTAEEREQRRRRSGLVRKPVARFESLEPEVDDTVASGGAGGAYDEEDDEQDVTYDTYDAFQEDFGVAGCSLREVAHDYNFPLEFLVSSACQLGLSPPVDTEKKLSAMLNGDQIFALLEAITTLDKAEAYDRLSDDTLEEIAEDYDVSIAHIFELCADLDFDLPMGVQTHLRIQEHAKLVEELELASPSKFFPEL